MRPNHDRISIILAEDHRIVAEALRLVLRDCFDILDVVEDGAVLVRAVARLLPDVVVTDLSMPKMDGFEAIRSIRELPDPPGVVVLSMHRSGRMLSAALAAGARGYVLKESAGSEVRAAVTAVHAGGSYWPAELGTVPPRAHLCGEAPFAGLPGTGPSPESATLRLTGRQTQVLELTARGYGMKKIAQLLQISPRTVESHKYQMMEALGAHTTAELVRHALRLGLIDMSASVGRPEPRPERRRPRADRRERVRKLVSA